jgi:hypothetical protein
MFEVTEKASARIKDFLKRNDKPYVLRILFQAC